MEPYLIKECTYVQTVSRTRVALNITLINRDLNIP